MDKEKLLNEQFRLECLKLAAPLHPCISGFGDNENSNIPRSVQLDAEKYYAYIKEHKISD